MRTISTLLLLWTAVFCSKAVHAQTIYDAQNISLLSNWDDTTVPAEPFYSIRYNGIWGWADGTGNEYALIGSTTGVYFVNVTNPSSPVVADFVAGRRSGCIWREIKTYSHYAYLISDDGSPNSFQIVDLQYLPDSVSVVFDSNSIFERAHTLWVDGDKLYCGVVKGGQFSSTSAMAVFDLAASPAQPVFLRSINTDFPALLSNNQVHDMFVRNDTVYASAAYDGLFIFKYNRSANNFSLLSSLTTYPQQGYNHSSALTDDGHTLVFMDEVPNGLAVKVLDVTDLNNLTVTSLFQSNSGPTPHNPFMVGNTCHIAYYQDGLQVYDVSDPVNPVRLGYFDTHYQTPMGGPYPTPAYAGAWGAYPFLPSGRVLVSDMQNGLYVLDVSAITGQDSPEAKVPGSLQVFPNPAVVSQNISVRIPDRIRDFSGSAIKVFSPDGQLIFEGPVSSRRIELNTAGWSTGIYQLAVSTPEGILQGRISLVR